MYFKADIVESLSAKILNLEHHITDLTVHFREDALNITSYHHGDQFISCNTIKTSGVYIGTISEYRYAVADFENLFHTVGDVDDRNTFLLQISDYIEQSVCLCGIQRRCRLVHDDQSGITGYCLDDLDHLYLCQCQFFHFSSSRIRNIKLIQDLLTPFVLCLLIQKNSFCIFTFQENTFCYRQMRLRIQFLMDHGNTTVQSIYRTFCLIRFSFKLHRSCILFDESDHTFHQCGFTCTVFSQQCMYFTRFHM